MQNMEVGVENTSNKFKKFNCEKNHLSLSVSQSILPPRQLSPWGQAVQVDLGF